LNQCESIIHPVAARPSSMSKPVKGVENVNRD
jgi:hypothetical protein